MKVIFSHGKESGPWGQKISALAEVARRLGFDVKSVDYQDTVDPDARVKRLVGILDGEEGKVVLVGSSMGGYVSLVAAERVAPAGLFLLAPALYREGYRQQAYAPLCRHVEIVHGWDDDVIPWSHSLKFASEWKCSLHLMAGDHGLNAVLGAILPLLEAFLLRCQADADPP